MCLIIAMTPGGTALLNHGAEVNANEHIRGQTGLMWPVAERHPAAANC